MPTILSRPPEWEMEHGDWGPMKLYGYGPDGQRFEMNEQQASDWQVAGGNGTDGFWSNRNINGTPTKVGLNATGDVTSTHGWPQDDTRGGFPQIMEAVQQTAPIWGSALAANALTGGFGGTGGLGVDPSVWGAEGMGMGGGGSYATNPALSAFNAGFSASPAEFGGMGIGTGGVMGAGGAVAGGGAAAGAASNMIGVKDILQAGMAYALHDEQSENLRQLQQQALAQGNSALAQQLAEIQKNREFAAQQAQISRDFSASEAQKSRDYTTQMAEQYNPMTMSALNQTQRQPYQQQLTSLMADPSQFWQTDPTAKGMLDLTKNEFNANTAKFGAGGTQFQNYADRTMDAAGKTFMDKAQLLGNLGGFGFGPGGFGPSQSPMGQTNQASATGTSFDAGAGNNLFATAGNLAMGAANNTMAGYEGIGKLFGKDWGITNPFASNTSGSNFSGSTLSFS